MDEEFFIIYCLYMRLYSIIFINVFYIFFMCRYFTYLNALAVQCLETIYCSVYGLLCKRRGL